MFAKLFKKPEPPEKVFRRTFEPRHLTRFANNHTRFDYLEDTPEPDPMQPDVAQSGPVETDVPVISPQDHLHSDAPIPVDLLRRTLPERFREMDAKTADHTETGPSACTPPPTSGWSQGMNYDRPTHWA